MHKILLSNNLKHSSKIKSLLKSDFNVKTFNLINDFNNETKKDYSVIIFSEKDFIDLHSSAHLYNKLLIVFSENNNILNYYKKGANLVLNSSSDIEILLSYLKNHFNIYDFVSKLNNCINEIDALVEDANSLAETLDIINFKIKECLGIKDVNIQLYNPAEKFWFYTYNQDGRNIIEKIHNPDKLKEEIIIKNKSVSYSKEDLKLKNIEINDDNLKHLIIIPLNFYKELFGIMELKFYSEDVNPNMIYDYMIKFKDNISILINKKNINLKFKESEEKIKEVEKFKSSFLSNLSHEVRTPMNSILGFSSLLSDDFLSDEEKAEYIQLINDNGNSLMNLITDMVDFAKIESGELSVNKVESKLYNLITHSIKNAVSNFKNQVESNIITDDKIKDSGIFIVTDPYRFEQSLTKLITNAIKFGEGNDIKISYKINKENKLLLSIEDQGIGIDFKDKSKIFESFNKINTGDIESYGGTGLGLSIVKGIMDILGIDIEVKTKKGVGSKFTLLINEKDYIKTNKQLKLGNYFWKDKTILIAEDNLSNYQYLNAILQKSKAKIIWEKDGYKAYNRFKSEDKIDLILMDILMPRMSGIECTKEIRKLNKSIPIIAQTAYKGSVNEKEALNAGCNYFFTKPLDARKLLQKIDDLIN